MTATIEWLRESLSLTTPGASKSHLPLTDPSIYGIIALPMVKSRTSHSSTEMVDTPLRMDVLVFSKTAGYRHASIPASIASIRRIATETGLFKVTETEDADLFITDKALSAYSVVVFLHNTGDFLSQDQITALQTFVRGGGGFVGIHAAGAGLRSNEWYGRLIGAHFNGHPDPEKGTILVDAQASSSPGGRFILNDCCQTRHEWQDEFYNFTTHPRQNPGLSVLLLGDTATFSGGKMGNDHPLCWYQEFEGGRSFYTALGHFDEAYTDVWFMDMITRGVIWAGRAESRLIT
ncbi:glycosyl hydrolase [Plectosphaerella plurivora]|uniref:Glycosyl hydrolase n=1 Tax=Plectosphaerella plurivora TaxID=936078 RepID=A0A9P8VJD0_9PEZI|nr:glycosyl hydrolase [Plectosphaerella plurivora]